MPEWLGFILFIAAVVLMKLLLPRLGARTCVFGSCRYESRPTLKAKNQKHAS